MVGYADLPIEILELIFSYLTVTDLMGAKKVCTTWHALINHTSFWFRRIHQEGLEINPELEYKLKGSQVNQKATLSVLQNYCLFEEDESVIQLCPEGSAKYMDTGCFWKLKEEDILLASVLLLSRTPRKVSLSLRSDPESIRNLDLFFLVLSYNSCDVIIEDLYNWRNWFNSSNQLLEQLNVCKRCVVKELWTTVDTTDVIPTTVEELCLSVMMDPTTGAVQDPGFARLPQHCPRLAVLAVHMRPGMVTEHLPSLPDVEELGQSGIYLYLSQLIDDLHLQWAVKTARTLQPPKMGYWWLVFPSCGLHIEQLCKLVHRLGDEKVTVKGWVYVSSIHNNQEKQQLKEIIRSTLQCGLVWYQDDDRIPYWTYNHYDDSNWPVDSDETDSSGDPFYFNGHFESDDSDGHGVSDNQDNSDDPKDSDDTGNSNDHDNISLAERLRQRLLHQAIDPDDSQASDDTSDHGDSDEPDISDDHDDAADPDDAVDSDDSDDPDNIPFEMRLRHSSLHQGDPLLRQ